MYPYVSKPSTDHSVTVPIEILKELLTPSEWRMVKARFYIMDLLSEGSSIRSIAERAQVGTDTVVRSARKLEDSSKLREFFKKENMGSSSKWIFGSVKNEE